MEKLVPVVIIGMFIVGLIVERLRPARALPSNRLWPVQGLLGFVVTMAVNALLPAAIALLAGGRSLFHIDRLGLVGGAVVTYLTGQFFGYWAHRAFHRVPWLWRWHQMHHSAERVDVLGAAYFHPLDIALSTVFGSVVTLLLGPRPDSAALAGIFFVGVAIFLHTNVRTPTWLGYLIQRPESHSVHHQRGVHAYNYAHLTLLDRLFGTFRNPAAFTGPSGLWDGASRRLGDLLLGREPVPPSDRAPAASPVRGGEPFMA